VAARSREELLYERLFVSVEDLRLAKYFANHLLKKGWHFFPWERRWTIYMQQAAYTTAFVIAFSRPFTNSKGWPRVPKRLTPFDEFERMLHDHLLSIRNEVYAHSDKSRHNIRPVRSGKFPAVIVGSPFLKLSAEELNAAIQMIEKTVELIECELERLRPVVEEG
jgi:hypothetical protein